MVVLNGVGPNEDASPTLLMMVLVGGRDRTLGEFRFRKHSGLYDNLVIQDYVNRLAPGWACTESTCRAN